MTLCDDVRPFVMMTLCDDDPLCTTLCDDDPLCTNLCDDVRPFVCDPLCMKRL